MAIVYLSLGSNLGDREAHLRAALDALGRSGVTVSAVSRIYETEPVGDTPEPVPAYLNCAARAETVLPPEELLDATQAVERAVGRRPTYRWGPRIVDVDILLYADRLLRSDRLAIPHPRMFQRAFVLVPLAELAPGLRFPDGTSLAERLESPVVRAQRIAVWPGTAEA